MHMSVTQRIKSIKQPRGGYLNPKQFSKIKLEEDISDLNINENISPILIGLAVDYLTRYNCGVSKEKSFNISMFGARLIDDIESAELLLSKITGIDDDSIISAVKLSGYDVVYRAGPMRYRNVSEINPDTETIENIRTMVKRALNFFVLYGPVVLEGFTFEGGYTDQVSVGDGDFMTEDVLWDFKVSKKDPTKENTLQLMMYWRMGLRSNHSEFKTIKKLGIYNPRLNIVYIIDVEDIPSNIIKEIEKEVIGY